MIIGIDASRANKTHKSGTEWYSYYLIKEFAKLDKENEYILYTDEPLRDGLSDLSCDNCHIHNGESNIRYDSKNRQIVKSPHNNFKVKILKWPFKFLWTQGRLSLEMFFKAPDVLFIPAHALPFIHPRKSITTIHDIGFKHKEKLYSKEDIVEGSKTFDFLIYLFTFGKHKPNKLDYLEWSTNFAIKHAKKIITISNFSKKEILKYFPKAKEEKIKVVYNGFNDRIYKKTDNKNEDLDLLNTYGVEMPYIFYIGRLERKKNIANLIEAYSLAKIKGIKEKLILVGDPSYGYDEVKYMVSEFGLDNDVIITGWVKEAAIPCILNNATAFVFPSLYEGFGIPLLQAMACGVPIAASNTSSIPEITADSALLFNPEDVYDMSEKIFSVINDQQLRKKLSDKGYKRVKDFNWEKCAKETLNEINTL